MALERLTRNYLGFQVSFSLLFWLPVFYEVQHRLGLTESQIFSIQGFYYLLFCLLELPTGWLADRFGSIRTLRAGAISLVAAQLAVVLGVGSSLDAVQVAGQKIGEGDPVVFSAYWAFVVHFALIAAARSLISGASNAYLFEAYSAAGRVAEYVHAEGRARAYGLFAKMGCWAVVGWLTQWNLLSSYWLTLGSAGVAVVYGFRLKELGHAQAGVAGVLQKSAQPVPNPQIGEALVLVLKEPRILGLMVQGMGIFVLARIVQVNLFQPLLLGRGFSTSSLGWVMALMTFFEAASSLRLGSVLKRFQPEGSVSLLSAGVAVSVGSLAVVQGSGLVLLLVLFSALIGFAGPIQRQVINQGISQALSQIGRGSQLRATVLSLESLLDRAACSLVVALMGPWVAAGHIGRVLAVSGLCFFVIACFQLGAFRGRSLVEVKSEKIPG